MVVRVIVMRRSLSRTPRLGPARIAAAAGLTVALLASCGSAAPDQELSVPAQAAEPTAVPTTEPVEIPEPTAEPTATTVPATTAPTTDDAQSTDAQSTETESTDAQSTEAQPSTADTSESGTPDAASGSGADAEATGMADATTTSDASTAAGSTLAGVQAAQWAPNVSIDIGSGSFWFRSDGLPSHELPDQFLVPADGNYPPFTGDDIENDFTIENTADLIIASPLDVEITLTPVYSDQITLTDLSTIGVTISGAPLFNDYEDQGREFVALDDNLSLNGVYFIDACNGHPLATGQSYHYHGVPYCITDAVDVPGQHSTIIGFALDGFPIYGSKDAGGALITNGQLDECSGHVGPTPEFPDGIYHYHLTEDGAPYSIDCFHGVIDYAGGGPGGPPPGAGGDGGPPQGERPDGPPPGTDATAAPGEGQPPQGGADEGAPAGPPPGGDAEGQGAAGGQAQGQPPSGTDQDQAGGQGGPPGGGGRPDFAAAAATLGVSEDALRNALGGPPPDFDAAAAALGISAAQIQAALDATTG